MTKEDWFEAEIEKKAKEISEYMDRILKEAFERFFEAVRYYRSSEPKTFVGFDDCITTLKEDNK